MTMTPNDYNVELWKAAKSSWQSSKSPLGFFYTLLEDILIMSWNVQSIREDIFEPRKISSKSRYSYGALSDCFTKLSTSDYHTVHNSLGRIDPQISFYVLPFSAIWAAKFSSHMYLHYHKAIGYLSFGAPKLDIFSCFIAALLYINIFYIFFAWGIRAIFCLIKIKKGFCAQWKVFH